MVLIRWERYQNTRATPDEVRRWLLGRSQMGLGIVAGPVSGVTLADGTRMALEVLDLDDAEVHARFLALVTACGAGSLLESLVCEATPGGGRHYGYLCGEWAGSMILARRPLGLDAHGRERFETLIESKGQGGQCVVAPTPPGIHPDHPTRVYTLVRGDWTQVPPITPKARRVLWACARALDEVSPRKADRLSPPQARRPTHRARPIVPLIPKRPQEGRQVRAYALTCSPAVQQFMRGGEGLRMLYQRPDVALACARVLGIPTARVGQGFLCLLPDHAETHPSASLHWDPKTGALMYRDWHARSGIEWYTLPDVRASLACDHAVRLRGPSVATWQLRLLVEARILEPYSVPARPLPPEVRSAIRRVYEGFRFLLACKWWHTPEAPTPFSWRFAATWCGLGERHVGDAMHWLLAQGFLRQVGKHGRTALFLPGVL
jgi:bifunctional DNA primase/polymerase-like protein